MRMHSGSPADGAWMSHFRRQTELAAQEEDYGLAARLRDESETLMQQLPPVRQFLWGRLQVLHTGTRAEQLEAISSLGTSPASEPKP